MNRPPPLQHDQEDRNRRNNLRLRGIPEATGAENLEATILAIFNIVLGTPPANPITLDRAHRAIGPRSSDPARPRDVICRVHLFKQKEEIVKKAWSHGPVNFDGNQIQILPDLSRATLYRRALLRPLLDKIRQLGLQYRWGYPFHLIVRRGNSSFFLRTQADLSDLFAFLEIQPFTIPDWLQRIPDNPRRARNFMSSQGERLRSQRRRWKDLDHTITVNKNYHGAGSKFYIVAFPSNPQTQLILFTGILIIYLKAMLGNMIITMLIIPVPHLHTPMYFLICNLSLLDMSFISVTVPKLLDITKTNMNILTFNGCISQMYFFIATANIESFLLTSMSYDRYVAICNPLLYPLIMNSVTCCFLSSASWLLGFLNSLLLSLLTSNLSFCNSNVINNFFCDLKALLKLSCTDTTLIQTIILVDNFAIGFLPSSLTLTSYVYIISSVLKIHSTDGRRKSFSNCTSHLTTVFLYYGTALCLYMFPNAENSQIKDSILSFVYVALIPMVNPLIYSLRNKDVLGALSKVTGWDKKRKITFQRYF
ncbi:olfactory receptor 1E16-like [Mantella aurantiaca]